MGELPSKWAICDAAWGEGKKHLYCPDHESLEFFATEGEAQKEADLAIQEGSKMVMVLEVKSLFLAKSVAYDVHQ
jgi:hypothetical protein